MSEERLRIGVIGLGRFVEIAHMPTYFDSPYAERLEVAAVADLSADRLAEIGGRYNIQARYTDFREMLAREKLDAVSVITPDHTHTPIVTAALEAGLDVLVEKPLAMTVGECHAIRELARRVGRRVRTDFHKREDPAHQDARARLASGRYGPVQFGYVWMQDAITVPAGGFFKSDLAARSSPVWFLGVHFFDCIRYVTGLSPASVTATGYRQVLEPEKKVATYDAVKADFLFDTGAAVSFYLSWNLPANIPAITRQGLYLQCAHGEVEINTRDRGYFESSDADGFRAVNPMFSRQTSAGVRGYGHDSIGEILMEFLAIKRRGESFRREREADEPSALNGLWAAAMGQAVDASLAAGQKRAGGQIVVGVPVQVNDVLERELGAAAAEYKVQLVD